MKMRREAVTTRVPVSGAKGKEKEKSGTTAMWRWLLIAIAAEEKHKG
jgi:hypothetical protein